MLLKGVFVVLMVSAPQQAEALLTKGSIVVPANKAVFLTKFCFDFDPSGGASGDWHLQISDASPKTGDIELVIFDDQADSYPGENAMWNFKCGSEKLKRAAKFERSIEVSSLPNGGKFSMPLVEHLRPRWWFVAAIDCSGIERTLHYSLHMTNPRQGWQKELSMDHCGLISLIVVLVVYVGLAFAQQYAVMHQNETARHPLRLILLAAIAAASLGMLVFVLDGLWFARDGDRQAVLYLAAKILKGVSKCLLASILMLLSQGICVSQQLHSQNLWQVSKLLAPFFGACLLLELWGEYAQSRTYTTGFIYCTWFGGALVLADLCLLALYFKNLHRTYLAESDAERQRLYCTWGLLYSGAFIVLPFATLLASVLNPWVREETIFLLTNCVHAVMLTLLIVGLWPERAQKFFCIDDCDLAKTIGMKSDAYANLVDSSPWLRACTPKGVSATASSDCDNRFALPNEDTLP